MKYHLLLFFTAYLLLTMALPRWRVKKTTGQEAIVIPRDDSAQGFIGRTFKLLFGLVLLVLLVNAFAPQWATYLLPAVFLAKTGVQWTEAGAAAPVIAGRCSAGADGPLVAGGL